VVIANAAHTATDSRLGDIFMPSDDDFDLTKEWLTTIAVLVFAFLLGGHGFWALSLCFTLMGATLFVALLAHEFDRARHRPPQHRSLGGGYGFARRAYLAFYAVFLGIHPYGAGEAWRFSFAIAAVAVVALVAFVIAMVPFFSVDNLFDNLLDIPATDAAESSTFLPFGYNRRKSQRAPQSH
jgi:hypothetical protein